MLILIKFTQTDEKLLLAPSLQKDDSAKQEMWRVENKFLISTYSYNAGPPRL